MDEEFAKNNHFMKKHKFYIPNEAKPKKSYKLSALGIDLDAFKL